MDKSAFCNEMRRSVLIERYAEAFVWPNRPTSYCTLPSRSQKACNSSRKPEARTA